MGHGPGAWRAKSRSRGGCPGQSLRNWAPASAGGGRSAVRFEHQQSHIALDVQTLQLIQLYRVRGLAAAAELGLTLMDEARIFSRRPEGSTWLLPR